MKLERSILAAVMVMGAAAMTGCNVSADQAEDTQAPAQAQVEDAKDQVASASTESFNRFARHEPRAERAREANRERREHAWERMHRREERRETGWHPWRRIRAWWGR